MTAHNEFRVGDCEKCGKGLLKVFSGKCSQGCEPHVPLRKTLPEFPLLLGRKISIQVSRATGKIWEGAPTSSRAILACLTIIYQGPYFPTTSKPAYNPSHWMSHSAHRKLPASSVSWSVRQGWGEGKDEGDVLILRGTKGGDERSYNYYLIPIKEL